MSEGTEHWSNDFEHDSLIEPESRESFVTTMSKYETQDDALIGGFNAVKLAGKPFKLPDSMESADKWPDEDRTNFKAALRNLHKTVESEDDFPEDFNWLEGLPEGQQVSPEIVASVKKFAVESGLNLAQTKGIVALHNSMVAKAAETIQQNALDAMKTGRDAIIKDEYNGNEQAYKDDWELMRRAFQNRAGLSVEEFEGIAGELVDFDAEGKVAPLLTRPKFAKAALKILSSVEREGSGETGRGGTPSETEMTEEERTKQELPKTVKALGLDK